MRKKNITFLCIFIVLILISSSCHPRRFSDIRPNMTKEEVVSSWGRTGLITYKDTDGMTLETWEYHFSGSGSICKVTFNQDKVTAYPQCDRPSVRRGYDYQSEQTKPSPRSVERSLIREGFLALKLAEALKIGRVKNEAEAEDKLASVGILPKNGWIADHPVTPDILEELHHAIAAAADSGKIAMTKSEAMGVFEDLVLEIESQYARVEPSPSREPYPETNYYPYPFYYRFLYPYPYYGYYDPYPYYYGGYYGFYRPYYHPYRYHHHYGGDRGGRGFHGGGRGGGGSHGGSRGGGGFQGGGRSGGGSQGGGRGGRR